jgi:hypothetical protein
MLFFFFFFFLARIGDKDELIKRLLDALTAEKNNSTETNEMDQLDELDELDGTSSSSKQQSPNEQIKSLINQIISISPLEYLTLLNLAPDLDRKLTSTSTIKDYRKAYMNLSRLIHPDKASKIHSEASKGKQNQDITILFIIFIYICFIYLFSFILLISVSKYCWCI